MNTKLLRKCFISFGFLLFLTMLLPFTSLFEATAKAAVVTSEKNDAYRLNLKSLSLVKGKTFPLKIYNLDGNEKVTFKSDDQEIASVTEDGTIIANKVGTTVITAIVKDGATVTPLTCDVTVGIPAFSVKLTRSRVILGVDQTDFLSVILKPNNTVEDARFYSNDASIASVSTGGRITGKKIGLTNVFAEIDATNNDGSRKVSACTVIVTSKEDAPLLEAYFADHPELNYIPADDFSKALNDFFNTKYDPASSNSLVKSLNSYLDNKFNLDQLKKTRDAALAKLQTN